MTQPLYAALQRVTPYLDRLPPSVARDVMEAVQEWELERARESIIQTPKTVTSCTHTAYHVEHGKCVGCGDPVDV